MVIPGDSKPTASRFEEARRRLQAGKGSEAIDLLRTILDSSANELVQVGEGRAVGAKQLAHALLAQLKPQELASYRKRVEVQARRWLEQADETGELTSLYRLVEEAFCTPQAMLALDRLGDRAFERGRFEEAEAWWRLLSPLEIVTPQDQDIAALHYPDCPLEMQARVQAKQLLARLLRRQASWPRDLEAFRQRHPKAAGRLAGRDGLYADTLAALGARGPWEISQRDWPTFAGSPSRGQLAAAPPRLLDQLSQLGKVGPAWRFDLERRELRDRPFTPFEPDKELDMVRRLAFYPVLVGHQAIVADATTITAYDLKTGRIEDWYDAKKVGIGGLHPNLNLPAPLDLRYTLTVAEGCLFARLGTQRIRDVRPRAGAMGEPGRRPLGDVGESVLVSLSLQPKATGSRFRWSVRGFDPGRKEWAIFEGSPVVREGRVWIAATRFEGDRVVTAVHCYPAHPEDNTAPLLWKTDLCETRELQPATSAAELDKKERRRHHLLTLAGSKVIYCSHSGVIVALDARTGRRAWAVRYPQRAELLPEDTPLLRDLLPPLFAEGRLYVAPSDSDRLLCLDPNTGATIWQREHLDVAHLVGVGQGRLIFTTWRNPGMGRLEAGGLRAVRADTGDDDGGWLLPDDGGGLVPFGRPLLVGDLVLWPTARRPYGVFAVRQLDGQQPDNPSLLHRIPSGNLVYANGCLLVTDGRLMSAFVPPDWLPWEDEPRIGLQRESWPQRLDALVQQRAYREILDDAQLRHRPLEDAHGLPQSAAWLARQALREPPPPPPRAASSADEKPPPRSVRLDIRLEPFERFLHADELALLCAKPNQVRLRSRATGELRWRAELPFTPTWARRFETLLLLGGEAGLAAVEAERGTPYWSFPAPVRNRYPAARTDSPRVALEPLPPEPLTNFHLIGSYLVCLQGRRRLLGLEARTGAVLWQRLAPGAAFELPAPRGQLSHLTVIDDSRLLLQAARQCWLLDARSGAILTSHLTELAPWPRAPLVTSDHICLVTKDRDVTFLDRATGRLAQVYTLSGETIRSGEPPLVLPGSQGYLVLEPLNFTYRLQLLDRKRCQPQWSRSPWLDLPRLDPTGWCWDNSTLYHASGGKLRAWSLPAARLLWECDLPADEPWHLCHQGSRLLVWRAGADAVRFHFRWLGAALQWETGPLPHGAGWSLLVFEADKGRLLERLDLDPEAIPRRPAQTATVPPTVWPVFGLRQDPAAVPGPLVLRDRLGVVAAVGNRIALFPPSLTSSK